MILTWAQYSLTENINRDSVDELIADCQRERSQKIAPLRAQAIDDCITNKRNDPEYCERFYRNYGERRGTRAAMFWSLPQCEKAVAADNYFKMHPAAKVYSYE